jgi:hypothetical protein
MSVTELLRHFKALPAVQRKKFLQAAMSSRARSNRPKQPTRRIDWPDVEVRAKRVTNGVLIPNLVLAEREETAF